MGIDQPVWVTGILFYTLTGNPNQFIQMGGMSMESFPDKLQE
jgi:hypothetical protein